MPQNGKLFRQQTLRMGSRCRLESGAESRTATPPTAEGAERGVPGVLRKAGSEQPALPVRGEGQQHWEEGLVSSFESTTARRGGYV